MTGTKKMNIPNFEEFLVNEKLTNKTMTINIDYVPDDVASAKKVAQRFKIKVQRHDASSANITGKRNDIIRYMKWNEYEDLEELYPKLFKEQVVSESKNEEKEAEKIAKSLVFSYAEIVSDMIEGAENEIDLEIDHLPNYKKNRKKILSVAYSAFKKELQKELKKRL